MFYQINIIKFCRAKMITEGVKQMGIRIMKFWKALF